mgnify:FL=1|uniref:hypothetical protein n=1 Tax=Prevotella sp. TaxID=59823 RepID=UPI003FED8A85
MITNDLLLVLKNFQGVREEQGENEKLRNLAVQFMNVAENILLGACFEVNGVRRIYPLEIEFYYHEEGDDGLKDPVMYHTNDHENKQLDYYPLGSLNCHVSGIDITFENEEKHYRASMLVRKYKVCDYDGGEWVAKEKKECEVRSTYIYEDMFMNIPLSDGITINWRSFKSADSLESICVKPRINVAEYKKDKNGKYQKVEISKDEYNKFSDDKKKEYFMYSGKILKKCNRMWNYSVVGDRL